jgi:hypothetical protein
MQTLFFVFKNRMFFVFKNRNEKEHSNERVLKNT